MTIQNPAQALAALRAFSQNMLNCGHSLEDIEESFKVLSAIAAPILRNSGSAREGKTPSLAVQKGFTANPKLALAAGEFADWYDALMAVAAAHAGVVATTPPLPQSATDAVKIVFKI